MAMKTKKERFHVGALNQDLEGEMSKRGEEEEGCGLQNALLNFTSHRVGGKMHREREGVGGKKQATHSQSKKSCPSCTIHFKSLRTHRFRIQLVSVLCQNLFHTGLFCVCYKAEPSVKRGGGESTRKWQNQNANSRQLSWKSMEEHEASGDRTAERTRLLLTSTAW